MQEKLWAKAQFSKDSAIPAMLNPSPPTPLLAIFCEAPKEGNLRIDRAENWDHKGPKEGPPRGPFQLNIQGKMAMRVGVPKEIKNHEYRIGMTPMAVQELTSRGHEVMVQTHGGEGSGFSDDAYRLVGAHMIDTPEEIFDQADLIVKVKEPQLHECAMLSEGQTLFTYLHLAADEAQAKALADSGCTAIAYETVTDSAGTLPLLTPMSEVAGRLSPQMGSHWLEKANGGSGVLLGGLPGVPRGKVTILGGGVAGTNAAIIAVGMGADVTIIERSLPRMRTLEDEFDGRVRTIYSTQAAIEEHVTDSDLVIGAVLIPGAAAPKLITRDMVSNMRRGSVMVDIAIDQGGCFETSKPTSHEEPTYVVDGVIHYCVTNMPGAVARTSTLGLNNATLPFTLALAEKGPGRALADDPHLANGLNVHKGAITHEAVAHDLGMTFTPFAA